MGFLRSIVADAQRAWQGAGAAGAQAEPDAPAAAPVAPVFGEVGLGAASLLEATSLSGPGAETRATRPVISEPTPPQPSPGTESEVRPMVRWSPNPSALTPVATVTAASEGTRLSQPMAIEAQTPVANLRTRKEGDGATEAARGAADRPEDRPASPSAPARDLPVAGPERAEDRVEPTVNAATQAPRSMTAEPETRVAVPGDGDQVARPATVADSPVTQDRASPRRPAQSEPGAGLGAIASGKEPLPLQPATATEAERKAGAVRMATRPFSPSPAARDGLSVAQPATISGGHEGQKQPTQGPNLPDPTPAPGASLTDDARERGARSASAQDGSGPAAASTVTGPARIGALTTQGATRAHQPGLAERASTASIPRLSQQAPSPSTPSSVPPSAKFIEAPLPATPEHAARAGAVAVANGPASEAGATGAIQVQASIQSVGPTPSTSRRPAAVSSPLPGAPPSPPAGKSEALVRAPSVAARAKGTPALSSYRPAGHRPTRGGQQLAPPAVHIGHIDIVVEAPPASAAPPAPAPVRTGDLLSRHYLRGL